MKNVNLSTAGIIVAGIVALVALEYLKVHNAGLAAVGCITTIVAGISRGLFKDAE